MYKISLCMIVRNEENNLEKCLSSVVEFVDEIIIIDTGSTDRTKELALNFTDKVYDYKWENDFSAARNYSIDKASNEYVLVLDADECLHSVNEKELERLINAYNGKVGRILRKNEYTRAGIKYCFKEHVERLFPKRMFHYEGIIHEQLVLINGKREPSNSIESYNLPMVILHSGYDGEVGVRKKKTERNINLLLEAQKQKPNDPYLLYQLGKSYYMEENYNEACIYFEQALYIDLDPELEYVQDMIESYGYSLMNSEQYEKALQLLNVYGEFGHSADFKFMIGLVLMNNGRFEEAIIEFEKATMMMDSKMEGVNRWLAFYNIGVIYECLGYFDKAVNYYKKCGKYDLALQRLQDITE